MTDPEAPLQLSQRAGRRRRADGSRQPHRLARAPSRRADRGGVGGDGDRAQEPARRRRPQGCRGGRPQPSSSRASTNGAIGSFTASWVTPGRKMQLDFELVGTTGSLVFSQERFNELQLYTAGDAKGRRGFKTILAGPDTPPYGDFCPAPGHQLGFNDLKTIEVAHLIRAIAGEETGEPRFRRGLRDPARHRGRFAVGPREALGRDRRVPLMARKQATADARSRRAAARKLHPADGGEVGRGAA